jgi:hypothetical protein
MSFNQIKLGSVLYNEDWESLSNHYHLGGSRDGMLLTHTCFSGTGTFAPMAQMAFQQVQATTFANGDNLAADIYSDADGKNNTKTGGTGSFYSNNFVCPLSAGSYVNATVIHSGLLALTSDVKQCIVYGRQSLETNTTITVTLANETASVTNQPLNTHISITNLSGGSLIMTMNLNTTNKAYTPHLYGYGVYLIK